MKKIIAFFVVTLPLYAASQTVNLDTIYIRNIQLQLQDWCWLVGKTQDVFPDSIGAYEYRRIRAKIKATNPNPISPNWTAQITIDSVRARIALYMYSTLATAPANEVAPRLVAIRSEFQSKPRLAVFITPLTTSGTSAFESARNRGKRMAVDN